MNSQPTGQDNSLIIVTSDHGQGFGERSRITPEVRIRGHGYGIQEVLTHVPLVVKNPNQSRKRIIDSVASLTEFPDFVNQTLEDKAATFNPNSGEALISTDRVRPEKYADSPNWEVLESYFGPWRAVLRDGDNLVEKYAEHQDDKLVSHIRDAQTVYQVDREPADVVEQAFGDLDRIDVSVQAERTPISDKVERRLDVLGYR